MKTQTRDGKKERRKSYHAPPSHSTIENENEVGLKKANHFEGEEVEGEHEMAG